MIRAEWYKQYCKEADIPLSHQEKDLMEEMTTKKGLFNEEVYIVRILKETSMPLTKHQVMIMRMLAQMEKEVREMQKGNRKG